jgi:hypothetical protein
MCKYHLANQNLTKFANYSVLFPQVQGNAGQEIWEPKSNNAIVTREKTPSPQWQGHLCIDNATMPLSLGRKLQSQQQQKPCTLMATTPSKRG